MRVTLVVVVKLIFHYTPRDYLVNGRRFLSYYVLHTHQLTHPHTHHLGLGRANAFIVDGGGEKRAPQETVKVDPPQFGPIRSDPPLFDTLG